MEAKNRFGEFIDAAHAAPVAIEKHGRAAVVVLGVKEYERLVATDRAGRMVEPISHAYDARHRY